MAQGIIFVVFLALIHNVVSQETTRVCRYDEIYSECGSACPPACADRNRPPVACILICIRGCFCREGLIRDSDGSCVLPHECKELPRPLCQQDEVYNECGTACPRTCENRNRPLTACPDVCVPGCFCKPGLIRDEDGNCILPQYCPRPMRPLACGRNEIFSACVNPCNDCRRRGNCPISYCESGCDCRSGYFRNRAGTCILASNCRRPIY